MHSMPITIHTSVCSYKNMFTEELIRISGKNLQWNTYSTTKVLRENAYRFCFKEPEYVHQSSEKL